MRLIDADALRKNMISTGRYFKCFEKSEKTIALRKLITYVVNEIDKSPTVEPEMMEQARKLLMGE